MHTLTLQHTCRYLLSQAPLPFLSLTGGIPLLVTPLANRLQQPPHLLRQVSHLRAVAVNELPLIQQCPEEQTRQR